MARSNSKSTGPQGALKFAGAAAAAIVGGVAIGYLFGGAHPKPVEPAAPPPTPIVSPLAPPVAPSAIRPHTTNADYTAPGAPRIAIHEETAPVMRRVMPPAPAVPADPEASQEAAPPVPPAKPHKPAAPASPSDGSAPDTSAPPVTNDSGDGAPAPAPATPGDSAPASAPPAAPADPDFERVNKPPDPQSGQTGSPKAQFRVQTGAFTDESNARSVADQLRGEGFTTSTRSEQQGDRLVYKVQVGAYRSKIGAAKVAEDLQKKGYTAFVSPITP